MNGSTFPSDSSLTAQSSQGHSSQRSRERLGDALLRLALECGEEGERKRARAQVFRHRAHSRTEPVALAHVRLQVNRRQVAVEADRLALEMGDHPLARRVVRQGYDVDEPGPLVVVVIRTRKLDPVDVRQQVSIAFRDGVAKRQYLVEL